MEGTPPLRSEPHRAADYLAKVRGLDVRHVGAVVIAPHDDLPETRARNDAVLALGRSSGGPFYPVCSVHPADGAKAFRELDRVARAGARCLKLHPNTQQLDVADPSVEAVVRRATRRGLPILFDAYSPFDAGQVGKFVLLAMKVPEARLILAHAHGPRFAELLVYDVLARYPWWRRNVWVDLSATAALLAGSPYAESFHWVLGKIGVDRLLFGSDYPLDDPTRAVDAVATLGFSRRELDQVFYHNAADLFGFDRSP